MCKPTRSAFTLAEVLITLGIIGVVASMTIPSLINSFQEKAYITAFEENYSLLSQAYTLAAQENGTADNWSSDWSSTEVRNNFSPYLKVLKDCNTYCTRTTAVKDLKGGSIGGFTSYHLILANGAFLYFTNGLADFNLVLDTNGEQKPNTLGYDVFMLKATARSGAPFIGWATYNEINEGWVKNNGDSQSCRFSSDWASPNWWDGGGCAYWLITHHNMDYLHRVIPNSEWK